MTAQEYKDNYSEEDLQEMLDKMEQIEKLFKRYGKLDKELEEKRQKNLRDIRAVKGALSFYEDEMTSTALDDTENQVVGALRNTALGREGSIFIDMFSGEGRRAVEKLIKRGIVVKIESHASGLMNRQMIGLADEIYPETHEEFQDYRDSGWSERGSYREFLNAKKSNKVEWNAKKIRSFLSKEVQDIFLSKVNIEKDSFWINYCRPLLEAMEYA